MPYLLLIMEDAESRGGAAEGRRPAGVPAQADFAGKLRARGKLLANDSLRTEAVRIEARNGKRLVVDGPFAESKEMVGGFFVIDCATRDEAIAIAAECPATEWAVVEVREIGPCWEGAD